jgi:putative transposase
MSADYRYPTDVTDELWEMLQSLLPERTWRPGGPGRPPCVVQRIVNGILYINKTGCQWRLVPKEFGHWNTIYGYFKRWRGDSVWARVMETLRQWERRCLGRKPEPSAGSIDSQSIKTATQSEDIGVDGNNKDQGAQAAYRPSNTVAAIGRHLLYLGVGKDSSQKLTDLDMREKSEQF